MGTSRLTSRRRNDQGLKWARITIAFLATLGVIDTGSITLNRFGWIGSLACPGGANGCEKVLTSAWGTISIAGQISFPLSLVGLLSYLAVLLMAIVPFLPGISETKANLSKKTWWGLFTASCAMSMFSLVLLGLMVFKIKAFCFFCLLSVFISLGIFILTLIGGRWDNPGQLFFRGLLLSLAILLAGLSWSSLVDPTRPEVLSSNQEGIPPIVQSVSTPSKVSLAEHLTRKGAVMYSAYWCPHCHDQKELFGKEASRKLKIIECAEDGQNSQRSLCQNKGIEAFPSWEINGEIDAGVKSLSELADISNFKKNTNF